MSLPVRLLPVVETWDCHQCSRCCYGTIVSLDEEDLARLQSQKWDAHPEMRGKRLLVRMGLLGRRFRLAQRRDGGCVFLLPDGRCRIHRDLGLEAKPKLCRSFPFQTVPQENSALLVVRRSCPSAAAGLGRPVDESRADVREALRLRPVLKGLERPPEIVRGHRRPWPDAMRVAETVERFVRDGRYPLVRRVVHALTFAELLGACRPRRLDGRGFGELLDMLEREAMREAGRWFRERRPPSRAAAVLFRRIAADYVRLHPKVRLVKSWSGRWRWVRTALAIGRGRGRIPSLGPDLPEVAVETLQDPLGPLADEAVRPLAAYFESAAASRRYSFMSRKDWPLVDAIRALAVSHPVATWLVRFAAAGRPPAAQDVIDAVVAIDRGEGLAALCAWQHRRRLAMLSRLGELARLVAWYAR